MNWFWRRKKEVPPDTTPGLEEAKQALEKSRQDVNRVERLIGEVRPVMGQLHERRAKNGFTALFEQALKGEGGKA